MNTQFLANYGATLHDVCTQFNALDKNYACPFLALEKLTGKKVHDADIETFQHDFLHELSSENIKLKNKLYIDNTKDIFLPMTSELKTKKAKNPIKNKGFLSLKNIVGKDEIRPTSQGVYFHADCMVATDAHKLVILVGTKANEALQDISNIHMSTLMKFMGLYDAKKTNDEYIEKLSNDVLHDTLINFHTGRLMSEKYFNYAGIIPLYKQEYQNKYVCTAENMLLQIERAMKHAGNFDKNQKNLVFGFEKKCGKTTAVNIKLLAETIYCLAANDSGNMTFYVSDENNRSLCIETENGHFGLIMPIARNNNDGSDAHIFVGGVHTQLV